MRRLNVKLLFALILGSILLVGITFLVNWLQSGRIARAMLAQAERAEQRDDPVEAARFFSRYIELQPDDIDSRARLAQTLANEKVAVNQPSRTRALFVLEQVLAKKPDRRDLRLQLVRLAMDLQRLDLAREHLTILTQAGADGEAEFLWGQLAESEKQWEKSRDWYQKAVEHSPQQIDAYVRLANVLRRHLTSDKNAEKSAASDKNADLADETMNQLVARNKDNFQAYLARWRYHQQPWFNLTNDAKLAEAGVDVERAARLAPDDAGVLLAVSDLSQARKNPAKAREGLLRGRQLFPTDVRFHRELAWLSLRENNRIEAVAGLREGARTLQGEGQIELLWMLANVLLDDGKTTEATAVIAELGKMRTLPATIDYLQARLHVLGERWSEAVKLLERSRGILDNSPEVARQADLLLAQCYDKLNDPQSRLAAYARIAARDPSSVPALLGKAATLAALGQPDEALVQYQQAVALPGAPPSVWVEIARLTVLRNLQSSSPDWKQAEAAIQQATAKNPPPVEIPLLTAAGQWVGLDATLQNPRAVQIPLLRAEVLAAQGRQPGLAPEKAAARLKQARELVEQVRAAYPQRIEPLTALVMLAEQRKDTDEALRLLDEAKKTVGDTPNWRALAIEFWTRCGSDEAKMKLTALAAGIEQFPATEQNRLCTELAEAQFRLGNRAEAAALWEKLAARPENQNDLRLRLWLFETAVQSNSEPVMQRWIDDLKRIEGPAGAYWQYCAAVKRIVQSRAKLDRDSLEQARKLLDRVAGLRPSWPAVLIARADLEALLGNPDQAIVNYRRAIELGERNPRVVRHLVEQLYKRHRYEEAEQEVRRLQQQSPGADFRRMIADIAYRRQDTERAASVAIEAVPADSKDSADQLWLGQVLAASPAHAAEAEQHLNLAVKLGGDKPETWLTLVQFLINADKKPQAEEALQRAAKALPVADRALTLAMGYEALGKFELAQEQYQQALKARPDDILVLRSVTGFYLRRGQLGQAEPILRQIIDGKVKGSMADQGWARRSLALALAAAGDYRRFPDALALVGLTWDATGQIDEKPNHPTDSAEDEARAQVRVLARQPRRETRQKAIALLQAKEKQEQLSPDDQFMLAQLYDADGNWPKARDLLRNLSVQSKNSADLTYFAQGLLRKNELPEADRVIRRLEQVEAESRVQPGAFGSVDLRAQYWEARGQPNRSLTMLKDYVERGSDPNRIFSLINALARQQRYADALGLCNQARGKTLPERVAAVSVALLRTSQAAELQCAPVATWLQKEVADKPQSVILLLQLANLEDLRGRYAEVEKVYRQILAIDPQNVYALNNLAVQIALLHPDRAAEAMKLIEYAIEVSGPQPDLLDTRATVHLALKRGDKAIADLELANSERPAPIRYFHLAQAHRLTNNTDAAAALLKKATAAGLKPEQLQPSERAEFHRMQKELEQR